MIEVEQLRKAYGQLVAVDQATFTARPGEIFGLLGPNGAGKSTTLGCICGLLTPTSGSIRVLGHDLVNDGARARRATGVAPQEIALYEELSARENLDYWGSVQGLTGKRLKQRVDEVLAMIGLEDRAKEPVKKFSGGMKRRLNFGAAIVHEPKVLLLDEPTVGVDPQSRVRLLEMVRAQAGAGTCVLYTTHYMEEAEALCDRLAIMDHGRLISQGTLVELRALLGERDLLRLTGSFPEGPVRAALAREEGVEVLGFEGGQLRLSMAEASARLPRLFTALAEAGAEVRGTTLTQPNLESLFIKLTGKELRE
ncbi:MAG: ABC transporter ATP-binding protein [Acidobacteria bacterium]|nr:ABC transporter ATP-binding protein [Acidobacteriota bacterium]